jgi:hypothetical protein
MKKLTDTQLARVVWAGILGPALFVIVFLVEGFLRPGYNPLSTYVSALSLGPRGWIQIANFLQFGLLLFLFTRAVASEFQSGKAARSGVILLTIIAICFFFSGPFVMDPDSTPRALMTVHGTIHGILGAIAFLLMPISMFVYWRRFVSDPDWAEMRGWSLVLGIISAIGLVVLSITSKSPELQSTFASWFGLFQRTLIIPFMVWVFLFALMMLRKVQARRSKA